MKKLNIGIVAHVDAGKTTLTESILFLSGVIAKRGRVDSGDTQTDSMGVERRRGISVRAAATSFTRNGVKFNLIDTPGHVDFVAEVERSLRVLDGVVLVISAKEGLQSQTRILMDTIMSQKIPAVIFINKIDRQGAEPEKVAEEANMYMGGRALTAHNTDVLYTLDDGLMESFVNNEEITHGRFNERLTYYTKCGELYPVFFGSALHGIGVEELLDELPDYLPQANSRDNEPLSGVVFKVDNSGRERLAYIRIYQGCVRVRDVLKYNNKEEKITRLAWLSQGKLISHTVIEAGDIGVLYFKDLRVGDIIGEAPQDVRNIRLGRPTLSALVRPERPEQKRELYEALALLADEDPMLDLSSNKRLCVRMFGEIQMEIIRELLTERYGIPVSFSEAMTVYMETPISAASASAPLGKKSGTFFRAGVGLRVEPLPRGSGLLYVSEVSFGHLERMFQNAVEDAVRETCRHGLYGWEVTDCRVIFDYSEYDSVTSTPADYRDLTPLVLMEAFQTAGMELLEPVLEFELRVPGNAAGKALYDCERMNATVDETISLPDNDVRITGLIPADACKNYAAQTASYTEGRGVFLTKFNGYKNTTFDQSKVNEDDINIAANKALYLMHKSGARRQLSE